MSSAIAIETAIKQSPQTVELYMLAGKAYYSMNDSENGIKNFMMVLQFEPNNLEAHQILANIYQQRGDMTMAKQFYDRANQISGAH